jgi:hypothetical protein
VSGRKPARGYSVRRGGLPRAGGRKADWATTWRPGHRAWDGVVARSLAMASRWQGSRLVHHRHAADAPSKKSEGGAHRGGRAAVGGGKWPARRRSCGRASPVGWRCPRGGPVARGGGEGGGCGRGIRGGQKHSIGGEKSQPAASGNALL